MQSRTLIAAAAMVVAAGGMANAAEKFIPMQTYGSPYVGDATLDIGAGSSSCCGSYSFGALSGRFAMPIHDGWTLSPEFYGAIEDDGYAAATGVANFYRKMTPATTRGFFVGFTHTNDDDDDIAVGLEAAWYTHPNSILTAYAFISGGTSNLWGSINGVWDYYFNPDTKVTLIADLSVFDWGHDLYGQVKLTHRFMGSPLSGFIAAEGGRNSDGYSFGGFFVGLTFNFDQPGTSQYMHDKMLPFAVAPAL